MGTGLTSLDCEASLKINCGTGSTVCDLLTQLEIGDLPVSRVGRACTGAEHRKLLLHMMKESRAEDVSQTSHG